MGKRGPKPRHTLDDLLDAATELIAIDGFRVLSMSAVARRLGTSVSGLYRYVGGLEELVVALQKRAIEQYRDGLNRAIAALDEDEATPSDPATFALRRVVTSFGYYSEHGETHPASHRLLAAFISEPSVILSSGAARSVDATLAGVIAINAAILTAAREAGALSEGDDVQRTYLLWASLHGLGQFRKRDRILPLHLQHAALQKRLLYDMLVGFGARAELLDEVLAI
ncbi:MAG: helix-turn-helix domain-containing protein [Polyangiaceae bacterium]